MSRHDIHIIETSLRRLLYQLVAAVQNCFPQTVSLLEWHY